MTANPPNSTSSRVQSQWPKPSLQSRPILERLSNSAAQALRPDSLLLEELLTSLKKDQFVLQSLREELRQYRDGKASPELVSRAAVRAEQLENECDLLGANAALMCGATAKATLLLRGLIQKDSSSLAESSRPLLFKLLISIAWVVEDASVAQTFLQRAATEDQQGDYAQYLAGVKRLLQARAELRQKKPGEAVRLCQTLGRETRPDDPLQILALELQADAFRQLGDEKREQDVLEDWEDLLKRLRNGPCDLAAEAETTTTAPGISGGPRSHEILEHFSRLAFLFERNSDTRNYAKGILTKFLNTAHHEWVDPNQPASGTISERMARLESPLNPQPHSPSTGMEIIEPNRAFGRVSDKAIEELLNKLTAMLGAAYCAVVIGKVIVKEHQFRVNPKQGDPVDQLLAALGEIHAESSSGTPAIRPEKTGVVSKGQPMQWIALNHEERAPDIRALSFGLRVDQVGDEMDLSLHILFTYTPPFRADYGDELGGLLRKKPEELGGYSTLEAGVVDLIKQAARRVAQRAGGSTTKGLVKL